MASQTPCFRKLVVKLNYSRIDRLVEESFLTVNSDYVRNRQLNNNALGRIRYKLFGIVKYEKECSTQSNQQS